MGSNLNATFNEHNLKSTTKQQQTTHVLLYIALNSLTSGVCVFLILVKTIGVAVKREEGHQGAQLPVFSTMRPSVESKYVIFHCPNRNLVLGVKNVVCISKNLAFDSKQLVVSSKSIVFPLPVLMIIR